MYRDVNGIYTITTHPLNKFRHPEANYNSFQRRTFRYNATCLKITKRSLLPPWHNTRHMTSPYGLAEERTPLHPDTDDVTNSLISALHSAPCIVVQPLQHQPSLASSILLPFVSLLMLPKKPPQHTTTSAHCQTIERHSTIFPVAASCSTGHGVS